MRQRDSRLADPARHNKISNATHSSEKRPNCMRARTLGVFTLLLHSSTTAFVANLPKTVSSTTCSKAACGLPAMSSTEERNHWEGMWSRGLKPGQAFDGSKSSASFLDVMSTWSQITKTKQCRMLVPGCGRGYDVVEAAKIGFEALGLDISPTAVKAAEAYRDSQGKLSGTAEFSSTDFFLLQQPEAFDLVFDYTFLCAIDPSTRQAWADTMKRLLRPGGELVTLIFPIGKKDPHGPPYAMSTELVKGLLEPRGFVCEYMEPVPPAKSHPGREGKEVLARWRAPLASTQN